MMPIVTNFWTLVMEEKKQTSVSQEEGKDANVVEEDSEEVYPDIEDDGAPDTTWLGFFYFCNIERHNISKDHPQWERNDIMKELTKMWNNFDNETRSRYKEMAVNEQSTFLGGQHERLL
ncbi:high mobility group protein DSP1-like isoform X1 [Diprion similis]|uniref:high mobility group protein DSP1-like isoform X1 n=2 Tax=Diprion similis TaxID=362088 RepID=UPI001EF8A2A9|nr:high mobility group protein DSP1-like isoform X1 [Diprion similis]